PVRRRRRSAGRGIATPSGSPSNNWQDLANRRDGRWLHLPDSSGLFGRLVSTGGHCPGGCARRIEQTAPGLPPAFDRVSSGSARGEGRDQIGELRRAGGAVGDVEGAGFIAAAPARQQAVPV